MRYEYIFLTQEVKSGSHLKSISGGNGKPLKIRDVYVGRDGKPVLVWQKGVGKRYICHKTSKLTYYSADLITWHEMSGCTDSVWLNPVYGNGILFASYGGKSYVRDRKSTRLNSSHMA